MYLARKRGSQANIMGRKDTNIPFSVDFSQQSNGAMSKLFGSTWSISSGKAINTPTLGNELFTNGGMEGTFSGGVAPNWLNVGSGTPTESADAHGGSKAQQLAGAANNDRIQQAITATINSWYRYSVWSKRTTGTAGNMRQYIDNNTKVFSGDLLIDAAYAQHVMTRKAVNATFRANAMRQVAAGTGDIIISDDASLKTITFKEMFAFPHRPFISSDVWLKTKVVMNTSCVTGLALCWDSNINPQNGLIFVHDGVSGVQAYQLVAGVWTNPVDVGISADSTKYLEIIKTGASVVVKYKGSQMGSTITLDSSLINNRWHGIFSTDPAVQLSGFVCKSSTTQVSRVYFVFDDLNPSDYTAYTTLHGLGLTGSSMADSSRIDVDGLTTAQMNVMYAAGWDFGNHTNGAATFDTMSLAQQEAAINGCITKLESMGFYRASRMLSEPNGVTTSDTLAAELACGIKYSIANGFLNPSGWVSSRVEALSIETYHGVAAVESAIAAAVAAHQDIKIQSHALVTSNPTGADCLVSDFTTMANYVAAQGIPTFGIGQRLANVEF